MITEYQTPPLPNLDPQKCRAGKKNFNYNVFLKS